MLSRHDTILAACMAAAMTLSSAAWADPPDRVGRLNLLEGSVAFQASPGEPWTTATRNFPLTAGNSLWTEEGSRAEAHVGSTAVRLAAGTELSFVELDDQKVRLSLPQGLLNVRLRQLDSGESFQLETLTMSVWLLGPGSFRIEVRGDARVTASQGELLVVANGSTYHLRTGQSAVASRSVSSYAVKIRSALPADDWDRWCAERDRREDHLASVQYVPRSLIGCEDLDWYGRWLQTPDYGMVWVPSSLPAGWAPYRFGRWVWVQPWGWTWVDDAPWGFAPFHYGRWALFRGVWVWVPGSIAYRPVYAPALVVFVGAGPGGVLLDGRTRWFPLGPEEAYVPPYRASPDYIQRLNIRNVRVGAQAVSEPAKVRYAHRDRPDATTMLSDGAFPHAQVRGAPGPVTGQGGPVTPVQGKTELRRAPAKGTLPPAAQKRQKVRVRKRLPNGQWLWVEEWVEGWAED